MCPRLSETKLCQGRDASLKFCFWLLGKRKAVAIGSRPETTFLPFFSEDGLRSAGHGEHCLTKRACKFRRGAPTPRLRHLRVADCHDFNCCSSGRMGRGIATKPRASLRSRSSLLLFITASRAPLLYSSSLCRSTVI